ncbi:MAG: GvpL/GvpF family gas vesicle protein [Pikeienuella sp.]
MEALGLTLARPAVLPADLTTVPAGAKLAVVAAEEPIDRTRHLALSRQAGGVFASFLPFRPGVGRSAAVSARVAAEPEPFEAALAEVAGCEVIVLTICVNTKSSASSEASVPEAGWLRARADARQRRHAALAEAAERGAAVLARTQVRPKAIRRACYPTGVDLLLLFPRDEAPRVRAQLSEAAATVPLRHPWSGVTVTGPWPCYGFGPPTAASEIPRGHR